MSTDPFCHGENEDGPAQTLRQVQRQVRNAMDDEAPARVCTLTTFILNRLYDPELNAAYVQGHCPAYTRVASQRFKMTHGYTLYRFIEVCRLEAARRLLEQDADWEASAVAAMVGYSRYRTFARAFKRVTGTAPTEYEGTGQSLLAVEG